MDFGIRESKMVMDYFIKMELLGGENGIWGKELDGLGRMKIMKNFNNYIYKNNDYAK